MNVSALSCDRLLDAITHRLAANQIRGDLSMAKAAKRKTAKKAAKKTAKKGAKKKSAKKAAKKKAAKKRRAKKASAAPAA